MSSTTPSTTEPELLSSKLPRNTTDTNPETITTQSSHFGHPSPGIQDISSFPRIYTGDAEEVIAENPPRIPLKVGDGDGDNGSDDEEIGRVSSELPVTLKETIVETGRGRGKERDIIPGQGDGGKKEGREGDRAGDGDAKGDRAGESWPTPSDERSKKSVFTTPKWNDSGVEKDIDEDEVRHEEDRGVFGGRDHDQKDGGEGDEGRDGGKEKRRSWLGRFKGVGSLKRKERRKEKSDQREEEEKRIEKGDGG